MTDAAASRFYPAGDGVRLHVRDHRPGRDEGRNPVVCLPGLTRSTADFERLARWLSRSSETPRRVLAFDYRGRGLSDHDADWRNYTLDVERADFLSWLAAEGIAAAHFIGTSRGGLHVMALAAAGQRAMIRSVVLNDIGPVLEAEGLQRIKGYIGASAAPRNLDEAIKLLKLGSGQHFDDLSADEWHAFATTTFGDEPQDLRLRYDPALARTLDGFDLTKPLPDLWEQFDSLWGVPVLTIRGANSDLLSAETLAAMTARWSGSESLSIHGQGHAPLLADQQTIDRIDAFLAVTDRAAQQEAETIRDLAP